MGMLIFKSNSHRMRLHSMNISLIFRLNLLEKSCPQAKPISYDFIGFDDSKNCAIWRAKTRLAAMSLALSSKIDDLFFDESTR